MIQETTELMKPFGKTTYLNLSACNVTDIATSLLDRVLIDDPDIKKAIVKIKGYNIIISKDETETN